MRIVKGIAGATLLLLVLVSAQPAKAALTETQVQSIVSLLESFGADQKTVESVKATLRGEASSASSSAPSRPVCGRDIRCGEQVNNNSQIVPPGQVAKMACIQLSRNITQGAKGDDVKKLQEMLAQDPHAQYTGPVSGVYGPMTAKAVMRYQKKNGISGTGTVGPMTRGFLERSCGKGLVDDENDDRRNHIMLAGTISAVSSTTITVQVSNGDTKTFKHNMGTMIMVFAGTSTPPAVGSATDLVVGRNVVVEGMLVQESLVARHIKVGVTQMPPIAVPMMQQQYTPR